MYFQLQNPQAGLVASASLTLGGGASAVGSGATGGYGCGEATNTVFTPTVGQLYKRCDNTLKTFVSSLDGAAEIPDPTFSAVPVGGKCLESLGTAGQIVEKLLACGSSLSGLTAATASNAIANGNNPQTWNWAQTTDSQAGFTPCGETSAATGGTLTNGLAIRMAVLSRAKEISIMRLVGATDSYIRRPFLLEGFAKGVIGGLLALLLVWVARLLIDRYIIETVFFDHRLAALGLLFGAMIGLMGSAVSVGRHLRNV